MRTGRTEQRYETSMLGYDLHTRSTRESDLATEDTILHLNTSFDGHTLNSPFEKLFGHVSERHPFDTFVLIYVVDQPSKAQSAQIPQSPLLACLTFHA